MLDSEPTPGNWTDSDDRWQGDGTGVFPAAGVPDLRQDVPAEAGDAAAVAEIVDYLAEVAEAQAAGDDELLAAIDADGLDIEICGVRWYLTRDDDGWSAFQATTETCSSDDRGHGQDDIAALVGPGDLAPTEIVRRLRTLEFERVCAIRRSLTPTPPAPLGLD